MSDHFENELKFTSSDVSRYDLIIGEIADLYHIVPLVKSMTDSYFDTSEFDLYRKGISYRIRRSEKGSKITLKFLHSVESGAFSRREIEQKVTEDMVLDPIIEGILSKYQLTDDPVLVNVTQRAEYFLDDRTVCLDRCSFVNLDRHFLEIEVESIDDEAKCVTLDRGLGSIITRYGFVRAEKSKYQRGIEIIISKNL